MGWEVYIKTMVISMWRWIVMSGLVLCFGCTQKNLTITEKSDSLPVINKLAVVGFRAALSKKEAPGYVRNPLSGSSVMAEPVPVSVVNDLTDFLFDKLVADKTYQLVSPGQVTGALSSLFSSDAGIGMGISESFQELGQRLGVDAVLIGYVYRWQERDGSDYAVDRPASAAFDLYLLRPTDGVILWKGKFDKTQKSLSENVLDVGTFIKGGGKWMTVKKLGISGLEKIISSMPPGTM